MKPTAAEIEELRDASDKAIAAYNKADADRDKAYDAYDKAFAAYDLAKRAGGK